MRIEARLALQNAEEFDVVGQVIGGLRQIEDHVDVCPADCWFSAAELRFVTNLAGRQYDRSEHLQFSYASDDGGTAMYRPKPDLAKHARQVRCRLLRGNAPNSVPEYIAIEGTIRSVTADTRGDRTAHEFELIDRYTGEHWICRFDADDAPAIGGHVGQRLFVEGVGTRPLGKATSAGRLEVRAFRKIAREPISFDELRRKSLRVPDDTDAATFIDSLRADVD